MERLEHLSQVEIERLIEDFREDCLLKNMSEESVRKYISAIRIFVEFLRERGLDLKDADKHVLREFLKYLKFERKVSHKTLENYFSALSTFYVTTTYSLQLHSTIGAYIPIDSNICSHELSTTTWTVELLTLSHEINV